MSRQTAQEIEAIAADWAARLDRAPLTDRDQTALDRWIEEDSRHLGAFMRMRAVALHSERAAALGLSFTPDDCTDAEPEDGGVANPTRRRILRMWGGGALAAGIAAAVGTSYLVGSTKSYATEIGEVRTLTLEDGTAMTLNTASRVVVRFSDEERLVSLEDGEALFDVARNPDRPFIVEAAGTRVRAVGTSFSVKRLADAPVEVLVREGVVEVSSAVTANPVRMAANTRIRAVEGDSHPAPMALSEDEVSREYAWRNGQIALEGQTLAEAAALFARYSRIRIVIDDPSVGGEEISGLFAANDPVQFAEAAASSLALKIVVEPEAVRITR